MADRIDLHVADLGRPVAQRPQGFGHGPVDDLEVAAARELLELHEREIGLDAGRVAIHHEADRARRRHDRDLGIAVAVLFAERDREIPGTARGMIHHGGIREAARSSGTGATESAS